LTKTLPEDRLAKRFPIVYRQIRSVWLGVMGLLGVPGYWNRRKQLDYYGEVVRLAKRHSPAGGSVIDVGSNKAETLLELHWFEKRVALDILYPPRAKAVTSIQVDFMEYEPEIEFDLVLCLQVLEHLEEPAPFAQKLLKTGRTVIISVPYNWPKDQHETHLQDPVDQEKLTSWTGQTPLESQVVANGAERLIAVYQPGLSQPLS